MKRTMVRAAHGTDQPAVSRIAEANGIEHFRWPWHDAWGSVAEVDGIVVAFLAGRDVPTGILIEEFWGDKTREGTIGLGLLANWLEDEAAQAIKRRRGGPVEIGGVVYLDNVRHKKALTKRKYAVKAELLTKVIE